MAMFLPVIIAHETPNLISKTEREKTDGAGN